MLSSVYSGIYSSYNRFGLQRGLSSGAIAHPFPAIASPSHPISISPFHHTPFHDSMRKNAPSCKPLPLHQSPFHFSPFVSRCCSSMYPFYVTVVAFSRSSHRFPLFIPCTRYHVSPRFCKDLWFLRTGRYVLFLLIEGFACAIWPGVIRSD
jgi:hypothetical protein